ncbi:MAG: uncharacterized protein KVP18_003844 [Porospora cf. gigantea A]|uniref:uncharacterized protein n=1 Tax=Porospora cf. gigantea A TaxID=2853593 RepID=UPI00355A61DC|nr:MAG: hypothetical protein KVP18_003844 [Porospora cf. gigantea A]
MNRYLSLVTAVGVACLSLVPLANVDPVYQILLTLGAASDLPYNDRMNLFKSSLGLGFTTMSLAGIPISILVTRTGCKVSAVFAHILQLLALFLVFFVSSGPAISAGAVLCGIAFQLQTNSHLGVAALFPNASAIVITLYGMAGDVSNYVPMSVLALMKQLEPQTVVYGWMGMVAGLAVIDAVVVPVGDYSKDQATDEELESLLSADKEKEVKATGPALWSLPAGAQIVSLPFISLTIYFISTFLKNKKFFAANVRDLLVARFPTGDGLPYLDDPFTYLNFFNLANVFAFIPAIFVGIFAQAQGAVALIVLHAISGTLMTLLPLFPMIQLQLAGVLAYSITCFNFSLVNVFIAEVFGFANIQVLQGIVCTLCGFFSLGYDLGWSWVFATFFNNDYTTVLQFMTLVGVGSILMGLAMSLVVPKLPESEVPLPINTSAVMLTDEAAEALRRDSLARLADHAAQTKRGSSLV